MQLDSVFFLACFLPLSVVLYYLTGSKKLRKPLLIAVSLLFYAFGGLWALPVLLAVACGNFLLGLWLQKKPSKLLCAVAITANLALLALYKYMGFFFGSSVNIIAPIGISFFTFKCISYCIDTYRDSSRGTKKFGTFLLYISFFPQMLSGPITRFSDFENQLEHPQKAALPEGLRRFVVGLSKKVLLCVPLASLTEMAYTAQNPSLPLAWLGAIGYSLQLYLDFSGYTDMAVGLGSMFGIPGVENFRYPYAAGSIADFWRRWHMSLSFWFRDYLYIPLGGNRKGVLRAATNKLIVFTLCGLWHGANWTFVVWGLWHGLFAAVETFRPVTPKKTAGKLIAHIYTLLVVVLGFAMFRAESVGAGLLLISRMFTGSLAGVSISLATVLVLAISVAVCLPWKLWLAGKPKLERAVDLIAYPVAIILLVLCIMKLSAGGFAPFIYAQF